MAFLSINILIIFSISFGAITLLSVIFGDIGAGKTLLATYIAKKASRPVYANYKIDIPNYHNLTLSDIFNLQESAIIIIDEAYGWLEARSAGKSSNKVWSYLLFQSRKRAVDIYLTVQLIMSIDIRYRKMIDKYIFCTQKDNSFYYTVYNKKGILVSRFKLRIDHAEDYFNLYDTLEIVITDEINDIMYDSLSRSEKKELVKRVVQEYKNDPEFQDRKPTHPQVHWFLFNKGYPEKMEKWVYIGLHAEVS